MPNQTILKMSMILIIFENWRSENGIFTDFLTHAEARPINTLERRDETEKNSTHLIMAHGEDADNTPLSSNDTVTSSHNIRMLSVLEKGRRKPINPKGSMASNNELKTKTLEKDRHKSLSSNNSMAFSDKQMIRKTSRYGNDIKMSLNSPMTSGDRRELKSPRYEINITVSSNGSMTSGHRRMLKTPKHEIKNRVSSNDSMISSERQIPKTTRRNGDNKQTSTKSNDISPTIDVPKFGNDATRTVTILNFTKMRKSKLHKERNVTGFNNLLRRYNSERGQFNNARHLVNPQRKTTHSDSTVILTYKSPTLSNSRNSFILNKTKYEIPRKSQGDMELFSVWKRNVKNVYDKTHLTTHKLQIPEVVIEKLANVSSKTDRYTKHYDKTNNITFLQDIPKNPLKVIRNNIFRRIMAVKKGATKYHVENGNIVNFDLARLYKNRKYKHRSKVNRKQLDIISESKDLTQGQRIAPPSRQKSRAVADENEYQSFLMPKQFNLTTDNVAQIQPVTPISQGKSPTSLNEDEDLTHFLTKQSNVTFENFRRRQILTPTTRRNSLDDVKEVIILAHVLPKRFDIVSKMFAQIVKPTSRRKRRAISREAVGLAYNFMLKQFDVFSKTFANHQRRRRAAVDEADDLAYLMQGESATDRAKMEDMIASDFSTPEKLDKEIGADSTGKTGTVGFGFLNFRSKIANMMNMLKSQVDDEFKTKMALKAQNDTNKTAPKKKPHKKLHGLAFIEAAWGPWGDWSECTAQCHKGGFTLRRRSCDTLPDIPCAGNSIDVTNCKEGIKCEAAWQPWGDWGPCSVTCGDGVKARTRMCTTQDVLKACKGKGSDFHNCNMQPCRLTEENNATSMLYPNKGTNLIEAPAAGLVLAAGAAGKKGHRHRHHQFTVWSRWGACSNSCGKGIKRRGRHCVDAKKTPPILVQVRHCGGGPTLQNRPCTGTCLAAGAAAAAGVGAGAAAVAYNMEGADHMAVADYQVVNEQTMTGGDGSAASTSNQVEEEEEDDDDGLLSPETFIFIALVILAMLLFVLAFCICIVQRTRSDRLKKEIRSLQPFYRTNDDLPPGRKANNFRQIYNYDELTEARDYSDTAKRSSAEMLKTLEELNTDILADQVQSRADAEEEQKDKDIDTEASTEREMHPESQRLVQNLGLYEEVNPEIKDNDENDDQVQSPALKEEEIVEPEPEVEILTSEPPSPQSPQTPQPPQSPQPPPESQLESPPSPDTTQIQPTEEMLDEVKAPPTRSPSPPTPPTPPPPPPHHHDKPHPSSALKRVLSKTPSLFGLLPRKKDSVSSLQAQGMSENRLVEELYKKMGVKGDPESLLRAVNAQRIRGATHSRNAKRTKVKNLGRRVANLRALGQVVRKQDAEKETKAQQSSAATVPKRRPSKGGRPKTSLGYQGRGVRRVSGMKGLKLLSSSSSYYRRPRAGKRSSSSRKNGGSLGGSSRMRWEEESSTTSSSVVWLSSLLSETDKNLDEIDSEIDKNFKTLLYGKRSCGEENLVELLLSDIEDKEKEKRSDANYDKTVVEDKTDGLDDFCFFTLADTESRTVYEECNSKVVFKGASDKLVVVEEEEDGLSLSAVSKSYIPTIKRKKKSTRSDCCRPAIMFQSCFHDDDDDDDDDDYNQKKKAVLGVMEEFSRQSGSRLTYDSQGLRDVLSKIEMSRYSFFTPTSSDKVQLPKPSGREETCTAHEEQLVEERKPSPFAEIWLDELGKIFEAKNKVVGSDLEYEVIRDWNSLIENEQDLKDVSLVTAENPTEFNDFPTADDSTLPDIFKNTTSTFESSATCLEKDKSNVLKHLLNNQIDAFAQSLSMKHSESKGVSLTPTVELSDISKFHSLVPPSKVDCKSCKLPNDLQSSKSSTTKPKLSQSFLESACNEIKKNLLGNALLSKSKIKPEEETSSLGDRSTDFESVDTKSSSAHSDSFMSACLGNSRKDSYLVKSSDSGSDRTSLYATPPRTTTNADCSSMKNFHGQDACATSCLTTVSTPFGVVKDKLLMNDYDMASIHKICISEDDSSENMLSCRSGSRARPRGGVRYALPFENSLYSIQSFDTFESHFTYDSNCSKGMAATVSPPVGFENDFKTKPYKERMRVTDVSSDETISSTSDELGGCPSYHPTRPFVPRDDDHQFKRNTFTLSDKSRQASSSSRQGPHFLIDHVVDPFQSERRKDEAPARFFYDTDDIVLSESVSSRYLDESNVLPMVSLSNSVTRNNRRNDDDDDNFFEEEEEEEGEEEEWDEEERLVTVQSTSTTKAFSFCETEKSRSSQSSRWVCFPETIVVNEYLTPLPPVASGGNDAASTTNHAIATATAATTATKRTRKTAQPPRRNVSVAFVPIVQHRQESSEVEDEDENEDDESEWQPDGDVSWSPLSLHSSGSSIEEPILTTPDLPSTTNARGLFSNQSNADSSLESHNVDTNDSHYMCQNWSV